MQLQEEIDINSCAECLGENSVIWKILYIHGVWNLFIKQTYCNVHTRDAHITDYNVLFKYLRLTTKVDSLILATAK